MKKKEWKAETFLGGKKKTLGYFTTKEEAQLATKKEVEKYSQGHRTL